MWQQKSFDNEETKGILYLVPTPIGNLEDITFRALRLLKECDTIACEDTRNTRKLCSHFEISTPLMSYHEHNKRTSGEKIIEMLKEGKKVCLVSDAGMPAISDPGYELVKEAIDNKIAVVPLPGANAALTALIASGLPTDSFYFYGFLQRKKKEKKKELEFIKNIKATVLLYESPHRLLETLEMLNQFVGDRNIVLCRELTKKYEEFIRGSVKELMEWAKEHEIRGEFCIVIEGKKEEDHEETWWESLTLKEHVSTYINKGLSSKEAIKQTAVDRNMNKREVYHAYHIDG